MSETNIPRGPEARPQDSVISFTTSRGSVYTYDLDGHTTRFKTATGEEQPPQDIAVFIDLNVRDIGTVATSYLTKSSVGKTEVQVIEHQLDGSFRVVTDIKDVQRAGDLALATLREGKVVREKPASIFPEVGKYVFDSRRFDEEGVTKTERHLGHRVASVRYKA